MKNQNWGASTQDIAKAKKIIKGVPYEDNIIDFWLSQDSLIPQWIKSAEAINRTSAFDIKRGLNVETIVEAYEMEYRRIAKEQNVSFQRYYMPIFFLANAEIKNRFIANQFLRDMKVISFNC